VKVGMIYWQFLCENGSELRIGGIETYLWELGRLLSDLGWQPIVFQCAKESFEKDVGFLHVRGIPEMRRDIAKRSLYKAATTYLNMSKDLLIFASDNLSVPTNNERCISIQHGISWDQPWRLLNQRKWIRGRMLSQLYRFYMAKKYLSMFDNCHNRVCVDYNFYNWYKTLTVGGDLAKIWVIPNCSRSQQQKTPPLRDGHKLKIIFARRFGEYRGSRIMAHAVKEILSRFPLVQVTFAGEGSDQTYLQNLFMGYSQVQFIKYSPDEAEAIHREHHIAVVPSLGSEGTSFAIAEAMGAGCAVIATHVGGITNMILDQYNGLLIPPESSALIAALNQLITNERLRKDISSRAIETAEKAFGIDLWRQRWTSVLNEVSHADLF